MQTETRVNHPLLVIDDAPLRHASFEAAEQVIAKMDRLEAQIRSFHESDQNLFDKWYAVTFRKERSEVEELERQYAELVQFHNWVIAIARQRKISMGRAFKHVRDEQQRFERGDARDRSRIEQMRLERDQFIEEDFEREQEEERLNEDPFEPRSTQDRSILESLAHLSGEEVEEICTNRKLTFDMLHMALQMSRTPDEWRVFLRIWEQVPPPLQKAFANWLWRDAGISLEQILEQIQTQTAHHPPPSPAPSKLERLKQIYRKLVRRIHPDMQASKVAHSEWQKRVWDRAQQAHANEDIQDLEKLYRIVLLRQHDLSEFTLSELRQSREWLEAEYKRLEHEARKLKRLPAWGFSRKKSYESLVEKIRQKFTKEKRHIQKRIDELAEEHGFFEML